jgi:hypothetical protein
VISINPRHSHPKQTPNVKKKKKKKDKQQQRHLVHFQQHQGAAVALSPAPPGPALAGLRLSVKFCYLLLGR